MCRVNVPWSIFGPVQQSPPPARRTRGVGSPGGGSSSRTHLPHVALGSEDDGFQAVVRVLHILLLNDAQEPGENLGVGQLRVAEDSAAGLNGLWTRREGSQAPGQCTAGP